ncbi:cell division protein FtsL [Thermodesulfobacteriota bacterium]
MAKSKGVSRVVKSTNSKSGIRIKNYRKKKNNTRITGRQLFMVVLMLLLFMGSGIGYVWSNYEQTQIGYDLSELKKEEMRLMEMNRKLRVEIAMRKSTFNLEEIAVEKFGLKQPTIDQVIVLP